MIFPIAVRSGGHAQHGLRAAGGQPQRDDLVEHEQRAGGVSGLLAPGARKSREAASSPPEPITGSRMTAATSGPRSARTASNASASP